MCFKPRRIYADALLVKPRAEETGLIDRNASAFFSPVGTCSDVYSRGPEDDPPASKLWSWREELNLQPVVYKTTALPLSYASPRKVSQTCDGQSTTPLRSILQTVSVKNIEYQKTKTTQHWIEAWRELAEITYRIHQEDHTYESL